MQLVLRGFLRKGRFKLCSQTIKITITIVIIFVNCEKAILIRITITIENKTIMSHIIDNCDSVIVVIFG